MNSFEVMKASQALLLSGSEKLNVKLTEVSQPRLESFIQKLCEFAIHHKFFFHLIHLSEFIDMSNYDSNKWKVHRLQH